MSYKSRQKKRIINASKHANREVMARRWYLTICTRDTCCARCAGVLRIGGEMVYRHTPRESLCVLCSELDSAIKPRPSTSWESASRRARGSSRSGTRAGRSGKAEPRGTQNKLP